jgi:hypothetical protein
MPAIVPKLDAYITGKHLLLSQTPANSRGKVFTKTHLEYKFVHTRLQDIHTINYLYQPN